MESFINRKDPGKNKLFKPKERVEESEERQR